MGEHAAESCQGWEDFAYGLHLPFAPVPSTSPGLSCLFFREGAGVSLFVLFSYHLVSYPCEGARMLSSALAPT